MPGTVTLGDARENALWHVTTIVKQVYGALGRVCGPSVQPAAPLNGYS